MKKKDDVTNRIKFTENEKKFMCQLLDVFDHNRDEMYYEIDTDKEMAKVFETLSKACGYSNVPEMDAENVQRCLRILGS